MGIISIKTKGCFTPPVMKTLSLSHTARTAQGCAHHETPAYPMKGGRFLPRRTVRLRCSLKKTAASLKTAA